MSSAQSGFGNGSVNFTVAPNTSTYTMLTGKIAINGGIAVPGNVFTVNQAAGSCTDPVFTPSSVNFAQAGGLQNVSVVLPSGCNWNLTSTAPWITPSNSVNSSGSGNLSLYAAPNSYSARMGTITLATKTITVTQAAGTCTLSLNSSQTTIPAEATAGSVGFTTGSACSWNAYSPVPWIQIGSASGAGRGSGTVSYVAAANPGAAPRTASLVIGDQTFQISQSGGPAYIPLSYTSALYISSSCCGPRGDGGPVASATVQSAYQLAFDSAGNRYIVDSGDARIRRVDTSGTITTFAGGGGGGLGDGGPPTAASFFQPKGVAVDAAGNVYVADSWNNRIRRVASNVITTIAGTGPPGYNGDNQSATAAQINTPYSVVVDSAGNVYFTDTNNHRIRKITPGGIISTVAGTGVAGFSGDGGSAAAAQLNYPAALAVDAAGNLYVVDSANERVREISTAGIITTVAGNGVYGSTGDGGPATSAELFLGCCVDGIAVDSSNVIDIGGVTGSIRRVTPDGIIQSTSPNNGSSGLAVDSSGNVYASSVGSGISKLTPALDFCSYSVSQPSTQLIVGGSLTIPVTATSSSCAWTASSNVSWMTVQTGSGSGNDSATFTVAANSGPVRSAMVTVGDSLGVQIITVNQSGTACSYSVSQPPTQSASGGNMTLQVTAASACAWTASSNVSWITVQTASGNGSAAFTLAANSGATRSGMVTVAGQTITVNQASASITMSLSQNTLKFGVIGNTISSTITDPQKVAVSFSGGAQINWTAASNQPNVTVSPASGTGLATLTITASLGSAVSAVVTVTAPGASNSPQQIQVSFALGVPFAVPFGSLDTPINNTTGVTGSIAVTGWALDAIEVTKVDIWREPVPGEAPQANGLVYIGDAVFVVGSRPDVETAYPNAPFNYRAGWGYLMLTTGLPHNGGSPGPGNGTYKLQAIAHNKTGASLDLGTRTITVDNAHAVKPFGAIDTPG